MRSARARGRALMLPDRVMRQRTVSPPLIACLYSLRTQPSPSGSPFSGVQDFQAPSISISTVSALPLGVLLSSVTMACPLPATTARL